MTHFATMIRLGDTDLENAESIISRKLAPYEEAAPEYYEFNDQTDEAREQWENDTTKAYLLDGEYHHSWKLSDKEERQAEQVEVGYDKIYADFDAFCKEYHGYERRGDRYGYMSNPNAKWDWYSVGGRYRGYFPVKPDTEGVVGAPGSFGNEAPAGTADIVRKGDIDFDRVAEKTQEKVDKLVAEWKLAKQGEADWGGFDNWRMSMIRMGLVSCEDLEDIDQDDENLLVQVWKKNKDRADVIRLDITEEEVYERAYSHLNQLRPYAFLDEEWNEPGQMGWWAMSSANADDYEEYEKEFEDWFASIDNNELIAIVDCHI